MTKTLDDIIDTLGFGRFSAMLILISGVTYMGEACELNIISIIGPQLRCSWNLSSLETSLTSSIVFTGLAIGNLYWGYLSDHHGRKKVMVIGAIFPVYFGLLSAIVPSFAWLLLSRFFVGFGLGSVGFAMNYIAEFISSKHRGKSVISIEFFYAFGSIYVAVTALLLMQTTGWRVFLVVATIPPASFLLLSPLLPESVRFLQNTGSYDEIIKIINRISISHNIAIPKMDLECAPKSKRGNTMILLSKEYRWKFAIMIVLFIAGQCGYFGVIMLNTELLQSRQFSPPNVTTRTVPNCHELNDKDYLQNIIVVLAEIPGIIIAALAVDTIGRKGYIIPGFIITGVGFLLLNIRLNRQEITILMILMRMILIGISQAPYAMAAEIFPTVVRSTAAGIMMGISRFVLIGVPFLVQYLMHVSLVTTTIIFTGLCFLTAILVMFLPETKDVILMNT